MRSWRLFVLSVAVTVGNSGWAMGADASSDAFAARQTSGVGKATGTALREDK